MRLIGNVDHECCTVQVRPYRRVDRGGGLFVLIIDQLKHFIETIISMLVSRRLDDELFERYEV